MVPRLPMPWLAVLNTVCAAISIAIVHCAFRDWPARYASHTLSWSVVAFFLAFVATSATGSISIGLSARGPSELLLRLATVPAVLLGAGVALGLAKAVLTGDF